MQAHASPPIDAPRDAFYDESRRAWVFSRYEDVLAALREPQLVVPGIAAAHDETHSAVRAAVELESGREQLAVWRDIMTSRARACAASLPENDTVDLVDAYARPWSLSIACTMLQVPDDKTRECAALARTVFHAAATSTDGQITAEAESAASALASLLATRGAEAQGTELQAAQVQTFIALAETLPALLSNVWNTLLRDTTETAQLRATPERIGSVVGELLRLAGPSRVVFREALRDVTIGGVVVRRGERALLGLAAANRDTAKFPDPSRFDSARNAAGHLAFGAGAHRCAGASLVKLAVEVATHALLERCASISINTSRQDSASAMGGFAISAPGALYAVVAHSSSPEQLT